MENTAGQNLNSNDFQPEPFVCYLQKHREKLENRKGVLINALIKRGLWWALLGVGKYCFSNYKIVWEAYGKKTFKAIIFDGNWQVNQSLQAFIPCNDKLTAENLVHQLNSPDINEYLLASKMEGTMNWAQPGKMASIFSYNVLEE